MGHSLSSVVHDRVLDMSSCYLALFRDHFDMCALVAKGFQMLAMGMFSKSFYASVVHGKVLEMLSLYLALF